MITCINYFNHKDTEFINYLITVNVACLSLRLGSDVNYSYTKDIMIQPESEFWEWRGKKSYWGYPMSVDGHIFRYSDIMDLLENLEYKNPNTLEGQMAQFPIAKEYMMRYKTPRIVNIPLNVVQDVCKNRNYNIYPETLNDDFLNGKKLQFIIPNKIHSCHIIPYFEMI